MKQTLRHIFAVAAMLMVVVSNVWGTVLNSTTTQDLSNNATRDYKYFTLSGQGDVISFNYKLKKNATTTTHNIFVEVSFDNNNWFEIKKYETKSSNDQSASNIKIPHARIKYLRIGLGTAGSQDAQIWNVKVTKRRTPNNIVPFTIDSHDRFWLDFYHNDNNNSMRWDNGVRLGSDNVGSDATNFDDRYFVIALTCIPRTLSFGYERTVSIATDCDWYVEESPDAQNWDRTWSQRANSGNHSYDLKENTKYIKFCYSGNYGGRFKDINVTESSYTDQPSITSWNAGTDIIGNPVQTSTTINWSNTTFSWELVNNTDNQFSVNFSTLGETCEYGTSTITATYHRTKSGTHSATLKIYTVSGNYEIKLSGETGKYTPLAEKKQDLIMGTTYNPNDVFKVYYKANNIENPIQDYTITALDPTIANYVNGQIVTNYQTGTARFQLTRNEDDNYHELKQTLDVIVQASNETCILPISKTNVNTGNGDNDTSESITLNGEGATLSFNYKLDDNANTEHYLTTQYSTSENGDDFQDIAGSTVGENDKTLLLHSLTLPEGTKRIRFKRTDNGWGDKEFQISNITITRKTFLNPQIDGDIFYLTQVSSGMQFAGTFPLEWSTCSDEIRFSCDNPNFTIIPSVIDASSGQGTTSIIVTYSANTENPVLTGTLTIYDQSQTKTITLSCEHLTQTIDWPQYFYNLEADENGYINQDIELNAVARTVSGQPTNQPIQYTLSVSPANASLSTDANGNTLLHITGMCEGTITAAVEGFTDSNGRTYTASSLTRQIRIRKAGTPCHSYALYIVDLQTITVTNSTKIFSINGLPENTMTFIAHTDVLSVSNDLSIDFSKDGNTWGNKQTIDIKPGYEHSTYSCSVPDSVSFIRFQTGSTLRTFFDMVTIHQKEYLTASVEHIDFPNTIVNQSFSTTFTVDYSDVPFIQYDVTNNHNLNLQLTPSPEINNNCGEYGTYTFTLTGMSPYPQEDVTETITIFTSAGHRVEIPITITAKLSETYYFDQQDGDWSDLNNWQVNGINPPSLPTPSNPVIITKAATIGTDNATFEGIAYSVTIEESGSLTVLPQGGLTVYAGGISGANENNLILHNKKDGAGFIRISPYFTKEVSGTMPKVKVLYETTSTLDEGANELAVWQYIGAPGADCQFTVDYITWLYHWSETQGWINKTGKLTLEPFAGYAITQYGKPTYELVAQPINSNQTITLTKTDTGSGMNGDNLFSNSYMTPIDVKNFKKEDFEGDIEATFYLFNSGSYSDWANHNNNNNTLGNNHSVSPGQYCAIPALAAKYLPSDFDITTIPPMQGVYVIAKENNAKIHLNYNKHVWNAGTVTTDMHEPMRAPSHNVFKPDNFRRLRIQVNSANSGADRMYVIQDTITTTDYDNGYDAPNQLAEGLANIYTNEHFGQMEVSCSNHIDSTFIGFTAGSDSIYTLTFNAIIGEDLHMQDLDNDSIILLEEGTTYTFQATPNSKNELRFQILLYPERDLNFGEEEKDDIYTDITNVHTIQVWSHGRCIYINNAPTNTIATLFNISGYKLLTTPIHHTPYTLDLNYLPKGVYMLQLNTQVYKFIIQ